ncbi:MAG TPA: EAL domain-containing protein [Candidatus Limnocylindrales bacterium]
MAIAWLASTAFLVVASDEAARRAVVDILPALLDLAAAWIIVRAAGRADTRRAAAAWALVGLAMVVYALGDGLFAWFDLGLQGRPFPSPADAAYAAYYPIMVAALLMFPMTPGARGERRRMAIDTAIVVVGTAMVVWPSLLRPAIQSLGADPIATALALAYPGGDLVLVFGIATIALRRPAGVDPRALLALVSGLVLVLAADVGYGQLTLGGTVPSEHWTDVLYMASTVAIAAAGYLQLKAAPRRAGDVAPAIPRPLLFLPYAALAVGFGTLVVTALGPADSSVSELLVGAVVLTLLVLVRQEMVLRENSRLLADQARRDSEARFRSLTAHASDAIILVTPGGIVVDAGEAAARVLGVDPATLIGRPLVSLAHAEDASRLTALIADAAERRPSAKDLEWRLWDGNGAWRQVETVAANLVDDPTIGHIVLTTRDVRERKALERQLQQVALRDVLTGLANRELFLDRLDRALGRNEDSGSGTVVLVVNIDGFKRLNDRLGRPAGDRLLVDLAGRMGESVRTADTCARLGGDEFGVLLDGSATADDGLATAERIRSALREPLSLSEGDVHVTVRIGIAVSEKATNGPGPLLRAASVAMTHARDADHDGVAVFEPAMMDAVESGFELESDLRRGIAHNELVLQYQPIMSLSSGEMVGAEALVLWDHPTRGRLAPSVFIPLAEQTDLIDQIGFWVLKTALEQVARWARLGRSVVPRVSVNLSPHQVADPQLPWTIQAALSRAGAVPAWLTLELSEGLLMERPAAVVERLHAIRSLGVSLAIDDFGTGYSSLASLQHFPVSHIKIDRSFVAPLDDPAREPGVVRAIVEIGRALGIETVADGVETRTQLERLQALGCDFGQGHLLGRPLDRDGLADLVKNPVHPPWAPVPAAASRRRRKRLKAA